jgi:hypothetical protein
MLTKKWKNSKPCCKLSKIGLWSALSHAKRQILFMDYVSNPSMHFLYYTSVIRSWFLEYTE